MKAITVFALAGSLLIATAIGYYVGRKHSSRQQQFASAVTSADNVPPLPMIKPAAKVTSRTQGLGLPDFKARLLELSDPGNRRWRELQRLLDSVPTGDIPDLLAFADSTPALVQREVVRSALLTRWAEKDPAAAMAYADKVQPRQNREQAILAVFNSWAEQSPEEALSWANQLPAGQMKTRALSSAIAALGWRHVATLTATALVILVVGTAGLLLVR